MDPLSPARLSRCQDTAALYYRNYASAPNDSMKVYWQVATAERYANARFEYVYAYGKVS